LCGIFGCLCNEASDAIIDGLKRLEYRGYDSVGVAVISGGRLVLEKEKGKISEFTDRVDLSTLKGEIGLGHTRTLTAQRLWPWSTMVFWRIFWT
jgi:glucosamine--fructose-6-phosphate aminotransferase (isomerizing)